MVRPRAALAAVLLAGLLPRAVLAAQTFDTGIRDTVLANGLAVIVAENHAVPITTVEVTLRAGAIMQQPGDEGVAHLFEHVLFRGYGAEHAWRRAVADIDGTFNGTTSTEQVSFFITVPSEYAEKAVQRLGELVAGASFSKGHLEDEVRIVIGEFERNASMPEYRLRTVADHLLWRGAAGRKDALGTPATVGMATIERVREYYRRYYVPNNAAVIVSGDVRVGEAFTWVARRFGKWKRGEDPWAARPLPPIPPLDSVHLVTDEGKVPAVTITLQWHGPSVRADPTATYAADVFSDLANSAVSGFRQRLVESGLFQSLVVNYYTQSDIGPITISGVTTTDVAQDAFRALRAEIAAFDDPGYVTPDLLEIAKKHRFVESIYGFERGSGLAHTIGFWWAVAGLDYFRDYVPAMMRMTADDLRGYVSRYIVGRPHVGAALLPAGAPPSVERAFIQAFGRPIH